MWSEIAKKTLKPEKRNLYEVKNFQKLIQILFFKLIIDNEANLHTLEIELISRTWNSHFNNLLELILQNPNFIIHNVKNLTFYTIIHNDYTNKIFDQLKVLESVHLINCYSLNNSFIQQIINLNRPFKLKSLIIDSRSQIDDSSFQLLLRKCGGYLENFGSKFGVQSEILLESIIKYCKNIKSLYLNDFKDQIIYLLLDLIENMKQSLNYLTISVSGCENYIECSSIILQNLGQVLPFKLEYLDLVLHIKMSDFEVFLKNSQDTFIKKLLINNFNDLKGQDILSYIKEYIMKRKE
ncbi:unnamed protein product [Rhizophagus irregularis]|nr:unnamed protein product [Rhizophagus irregularis]